jgi:hypothetical protein
MRRLLSIVAGLIVGGVLVIGTSASAQAPTGTTITLRELDRGSTFRVIDQAPRSRSQRNPTFSMGDGLVFSNPLVNASNARIGTLYAVCTVVKAGGFSTVVALCQGTYRLGNGHIEVQVLARLSQRTVTGAVVGGTGAYANMRGTFASTSRANDDSDTTITLVP